MSATFDVLSTPIPPVRRLRPATTRLTACVTALLVVTTASRADDPAAHIYITPDAAAQNEDFGLQGEYTGDNLGLQVVAQGNGQFLAVIHRGGLPGAGFDGGERQTLEEDANGIRNLIESLELERIERKSPTLGAEPPKGAVVLFDGSQQSLEQHWQPGARRTDDGLLIQGATSIDKFQDHTLHLEFLTPFMPLARGQARGNSGVYYQGRFETQVLDSFGMEGQMNETGGIYSIKDPDLNMCLPPLVWQTYDVDFTAARYDDSGTKTANARMTVRLNGVVVQRDVELPHITTAAPVSESPATGPLYLQDHGNPVRYRNIWVLPRDFDREARRPIVSAFERFHTATGSEAVTGGRLLLGELACTKCHVPSDELKSLLLVKEPPILTQVGARLHPEWMYKFLLYPHDAKPGTSMPSLLKSLPPEEREPAARALVNFLMTTGNLAQSSLEAEAAQRGAKLFHEVGCVQCHAPRDGHTVATGTSVPLVNIEQKYSIPSLAEFLKNPHKVRPSGRMPGWRLDDKQLQDIAAYFIGEVTIQPLNPNLKVAVYEGSWDQLPDFTRLTHVRTGESAGLDVNVAGRGDNFGLVFEGFLPIEKKGNYTFHLGSDDGSRLVIDDIEVVKNDGIHPHSVASGTTKLDAGPHAIRIEYFEKGGEQSLSLEYEHKFLTRQDVTHKFTLTPEGNPNSEPQPVDPETFVFDESLVARGRELFATLGCASCHRLQPGGERIASRLSAKPFADCDLTQGCLTDGAETAAPRYDLSPTQQSAITAALSTDRDEGDAATTAVIHRTMLAFNCYACHSRGDIGGPTPDRNELFTSTIPEMGDEGRIPPPLDGVGDKLNDGFLAEVLKDGASDRPYMHTRMPKFGDRNVGHLAAAFVDLDRRTEAELADIPEPLHRIKATGRQLVGDKGLACIKCHTFGPHRATGIQAIGLLEMPRRLRDDWFLRYLVNPNEYRPGTRMPTGFPEGKATIRDVYDGHPQQQVTAIWRYLQDGSKAGIPDGLIAKMIELKPTDVPIIYRNFIDGLSPRGIAVGYPEKCHLAWDANRMCLTLVWHGRFIDASRHWEGRGQGFQPPLGDHVLRIEDAPPLAILDSQDSPWPIEEPRESGYHFKGYHLDAAQRPTFKYSGPGFTVTDYCEPQPRGEQSPYFRRRLTITADSPVEGLHFRAARGQSIEPLPEGGWRIDNALTIRVQGGGVSHLREAQGRLEILVPIDVTSGTVEINQELDW